MSPPDRSKGEYRRAQHDGDQVTPPDRSKGEYRRAQHDGDQVIPPDRSKGEYRCAQHDGDQVTPPDQLFALLYQDLHQLARSRMRQAGDLTLLNTTDLLHESFLRMRRAAPEAFADKQHFLAYAASAMRSVVVDMVRSAQAQRHGGALQQVTWHTGLPDAGVQHADEVLRVHEALADLARTEPRLATVVELRYFGGLTEAETAALLGVTLRTVQRDWAKARLYLSMALG